jgi:hypothetical protein
MTSSNGDPARPDPRPPDHAPNQTSMVLASFSWNVERSVHPNPDHTLERIVTLDVVPFFALAVPGQGGPVGAAQEVRVQQASVRLVMTEDIAQLLAAQLAGRPAIQRA